MRGEPRAHARTHARLAESRVLNMCTGINPQGSGLLCSPAMSLGQWRVRLTVQLLFPMRALAGVNQSAMTSSSPPSPTVRTDTVACGASGHRTTSSRPMSPAVPRFSSHGYTTYQIPALPTGTACPQSMASCFRAVRSSGARNHTAASITLSFTVHPIRIRVRWHVCRRPLPPMCA